MLEEGWVMAVLNFMEEDILEFTEEQTPNPTILQLLVEGVEEVYHKESFNMEEPQHGLEQRGKEARQTHFQEVLLKIQQQEMAFLLEVAAVANHKEGKGEGQEGQDLLSKVETVQRSQATPKLPKKCRAAVVEVILEVEAVEIPIFLLLLVEEDPVTQEDFRTVLAKMEIAAVACLEAVKQECTSQAMAGRIK
jgi:hypothetical protein